VSHTGMQIAGGSVSMRDTGVEESTMQLVLDQLEELAVTIIEEVRERPGVALAICAGVAGAVVGSMLAARTRRRSPASARMARRPARRFGEAAELAGLGFRLMQNPIVRGLVLAAVERQLRRRLRF
jgi:hypothetical protein